MEFNLADLWERVVEVIPDRPAMISVSGTQSFAELDRRANQLARGLVANGIGAGDHVALYLHNGPEYLEAMLATFKIRAVPINVNYRYVERELVYLLNDARAVAVIYHDAFKARLNAIADDVPLATTFIEVSLTETPRGIPSAIPSAIPLGIHAPNARPITLAYEALLAAHNGDQLSISRSGDDIYILYTGGTTGLPKGVMWRHEDVFFAAMGGGSNGADPITTPEAIAERCVRGTTRLIVPCPFMHGTAHWMAFATLLTGGCVLPLQTVHFDPNEVLDVVEQHHANTVVIVGDAYAVPIIDAIAHRLTVAGSDPHGVDALSVVISGGAVLSPSIKRALLAALPHAVIVDGYGASETGGQGRAVCTAGQEIVATAFIVDADSEVLDDDGNPSAVGTIGRVARRGHVPLGYFNDPEKSAATFTTTRGVRWSIPGDHGIREPNGTITLLGRGSMCINTGGEKVYPDEVESVLKSHPAVFDAVVIGFADARFGQRVGAVVQLRDDTVCTIEQLQHHARSMSASYKIPRRVAFVDAVTRSPSGKPDYQWAALQLATALVVDDS